MPNPSDIVRIRNVGHTPFRGKLSPTQWATIPAPPDPRSESLFTFDVACMWLGNPGITNPKEREARLTQLRTFYGVYDDRERWETDLPRLEVYDVTTNERIFMLLDDPDGTGGLTAQVVPAGDAATAMILERLAASERETQMLRAELARFVGAQHTPATVPPAVDAHGNSSIDQAPVVTGQPMPQPAPTPQPVRQDPGEGEATVAPGLQPNGDLVLPNGTVIPKGGRKSESFTPVDVPPELAAENRSGARSKSTAGGFTPVDPGTIASATEDTPRAARV